MGIVTHPNNAGTHHGIRLGIGPERVLGIPIGTNRYNTDFWDQLLHKLRSKLSVWKHRDLSFEGKVHLIKSIGISQLTYAMDMMNVKDKVISETDRIIYQFLCSDKRYTIKKDVYTLPQNMGCLGMIDVLALIKAKIIKFIMQVLKRAEQKWAKKCHWNISNAWIIIFVYPFFTLMALDTTGLIEKKNIPPFYKNCIAFFQEMCRKSKVIDKEKDEILWGNSAFKFNGSPLFLKHWAKVGITHTSDIIKDKELDENGKYEQLVHKASFFFDIRKVKAALPDSWKNKSIDKNNNASPQKLLDMLFIIPGGGKKPWEICHKRTFIIFSFWI